jgi:hypothetical protein
MIAAYKGAMRRLNGVQDDQQSSTPQVAGFPEDISAKEVGMYFN